MKRRKKKGRGNIKDIKKLVLKYLQKKGKSVKKWFSQIDRKKKGRIRLKEFIRGVQKLDKGLSESDAKSLFREIDDADQGYLTLEQL